MAWLSIRAHADRTGLTSEEILLQLLNSFLHHSKQPIGSGFTNELTDISVGDAWHPRYEAQKGGFSVVIARSEKGEKILIEMQRAGLLTLEEIAVDEALAMHAHMLDFKKRGTFIRLQWRRIWKRHVPNYGYRPISIPFSRRLVELVILSIFSTCRTRFSRLLVEKVPLRVIGPLFERLRRLWKGISKSTKRQGLNSTRFEIV